MSDLPAVIDEQDDDPDGVGLDDAPETPQIFDRDRDLLDGSRPNSPIRKRLTDLFKSVSEGFEHQSDRAEDQQQYWRCFNCELDENQVYDGNACIYVPIVHDAVNARVTRFSGQLFPQSGRYVDVIAADGSTPNDIIAVGDHYIRERRLKTQVVKPMLRNGDIEGQYNLYVDWSEIERTIVTRSVHGPRDPLTGAEMPGEDIEDIEEETIDDGFPGFEVLHDSDVLVWPATVDTIEEAIANGGGCAIVRRWSKEKIKAMIADGAIRKSEGESLIDTMGRVNPRDDNLEKGLAEHVGIRAKGKEAVVWEVWANLRLGKKGFSEDGDPRLCRIFFGPDQAALGVKRNPYWNDRCPLLSCPVEKVSGVFKGDPLISTVAQLQYEANDALNEGADSAAYAALPIVARDPEKGNGPMILNLAAIWDIEPDAVKFMTFPDLTPRAITRVQYCMQQIFQTLGVNPAMIPHQTGRPGSKRNQAEVAMEQSVDLMTTSEAVSVAEEGVLTPLMGWMVDLDYQYRDKPMMVRMFGEMGKKAVMQEVAPLQNRNGFTFIWRGAEQARMNAQLIQQGTGLLNVLKGMRQDLMAEGIQLRLAPFIEAAVSNTLGPILAARTLVDVRDQLTVPVDETIQMLADGFEVPPHPMEDDRQYIMALQQALQATGDPHGTIRVRLQAQLKQAAMKAQANMMKALPPPQMPGQPGPGGAGAPQPGAIPAGPRLIKGPAGMIHPDAMPAAGGMGMPRKM